MVLMDLTKSNSKLNFSNDSFELFLKLFTTTEIKMPNYFIINYEIFQISNFWMSWKI